MSRPLHIEGASRTWSVLTKEELAAALSTKDGRGGGEFWLASPGQKFPCLAIRSSGPAFDIHYFPAEGHPGYRYREAQAKSTSQVALFQYDGCDPYEGESVPIEFTVAFDIALTVAHQFMVSGAMHDSTQWLEL